MPIELPFGFQLGKKTPSPDIEPKKQESFVAPESYDGTYTLETGGVFGTYVDFAGSMRNDNAAIAQYRQVSMYPEVDQAIEDIINEAIINNDDRKPVKLDLSDNDEISENIKNKIYKEYDYILKTLDFGTKASDIFRRWYIDSKLYYHIIIDKEQPQAGIKELRAIDPIKIKKVRKVNKDKERVGTTQVPFIKDVEEFFVYTDTDNAYSHDRNQNCKGFYSIYTFWCC